jgi:protein-disulfide isomerase
MPPVERKTTVAFGVGALALFALGLLLGGMFVKIQYLEGKWAVNKPEVAGVQNPAQAPAGPTAVNIKISPEDPVLGDPNAKLTIVEFSDYQCPFCSQWQRDIFPQIKKDYIDTGKAKFVYKQFAFLGKESTDAANAALCAKEQNKFWEYHEKLFTSQSGENQGAFSPANLKQLAAGMGLAAGQFNACLDQQKYNAQIQADMAEANKNGLQSTPSTAVGTTPVIGAQPYAQFKTAIDNELAKQ